MNFEVIWDEKAYDQLDKLEPIIQKRLVKKIRDFKNNPFSKDIDKLKDSNYYRLRIGNFRIICELERNKIKILKIGHRKNIYKK